MKKKISLVLSMLMLVTLCLAGCGKTQTNVTEEQLPEINGSTDKEYGETTEIPDSKTSEVEESSDFTGIYLMLDETYYSEMLGKEVRTIYYRVESTKEFSDDTYELEAENLTNEYAYFRFASVYGDYGDISDKDEVNRSVLDGAYNVVNRYGGLYYGDFVFIISPEIELDAEHSFMHAYKDEYVEVTDGANHEINHQYQYKGVYKLDDFYFIPAENQSGYTGNDSYTMSNAMYVCINGNEKITDHLGLVTEGKVGDYDIINLEASNVEVCYCEYVSDDSVFEPTYRLHTEAFTSKSGAVVIAGEKTDIGEGEPAEFYLGLAMTDGSKLSEEDKEVSWHLVFHFLDTDRYLVWYF